MLAEIINWFKANETVPSGVAAAVVVLSIVGAAMRGALTRGATSFVGALRSRREVRANLSEIDVSQPVPGFGGRPAIAVLPFDNMSGDPEQDYFADGITEDILTSLQSFRTFPVIARNSSFAYKGKSMDLREVAKELGAGYILEGSVRKSGDKIRITGQLIDADGHHVWADRFDRDLSDIFEVQDEITAKIVGAIAPEIENSDIRRVQSKPTKNMDAWDCVLRSKPLIHESSIESLRKARELLDNAVELDPQFAHAFEQLAAALIADYVRFGGNALGTGSEHCLDLTAENATKALSLNPSMPHAHALLSMCHVFRGQSDLGLTEAEEAIRLNPSDLLVRTVYSQALLAVSKFDEAIEQLALGKRLSPGDTGIGRLLTIEALVLFAMGRHGDSEKRVREAIAARPRNPTARFIQVAALDALGRKDEAHLAYLDLIRLAPQSSPNFIIQMYTYHREIAQQFREALGRAGWEG